jgi:ribonuclease HI
MDYLEQEILEPEKKTELIMASIDGGNFLTNPGPGGIGIVLHLEKNGFRFIKTISRYIPRWVEIQGDFLELSKKNKTKKPIEKDGKWYMETTNNRCEIMAIIEAMSRIKNPENTDMIISSDSQWAINMTNGSWNAKENLDLVFLARKLYNNFNSIEIKWIRGHSGDRFNEWCDQLATLACKEKKKEPVINVIKEKL